MRPATLRYIMVLVAFMANSFAQAAPYAYAINSDAESNADHLIRIDLATGQSEDIGALPARYEDVEGLSIASSGKLFAVDDASDTLLTIDTETASASAIGDTIGNLGLDTASGDYGLSATCSGNLILSSDQNSKLWSVDSGTGAASEILSGLETGFTANAVAGNMLFAVGASGHEALYQIDLERGEVVKKTPLTGLSYEDAGMAFDDNGQLWLVTDGTRISAGTFDPSQIYKLDIETGSYEFIAETTGGVESLAITTPFCSAAGVLPLAQEIPALSWPAYFLLFSMLVLTTHFSRRLL